jgi:hypothetical protein
MGDGRRHASVDAKRLNFAVAAEEPERVNMSWTRWSMADLVACADTGVVSSGVEVEYDLVVATFGTERCSACGFEDRQAPEVAG